MCFLLLYLRSEEQMQSFHLLSATAQYQCGGVRVRARGTGANAMVSLDGTPGKTSPLLPYLPRHSY